MRLNRWPLWVLTISLIVDAVAFFVFIQHTTPSMPEVTSAISALATSTIACISVCALMVAKRQMNEWRVKESSSIILDVEMSLNSIGSEYISTLTLIHNWDAQKSTQATELCSNVKELTSDQRAYIHESIKNLKALDIHAKKMRKKSPYPLIQLLSHISMINVLATPHNLQSLGNEGVVQVLDKPISDCKIAIEKFEKEFSGSANLLIIEALTEYRLSFLEE